MYFLTQYIIFKLVGNTTLLNYAKKKLFTEELIQWVFYMKIIF